LPARVGVRVGVRVRVEPSVLMQSSNSHKVFIGKQCEGKCTVSVLNLWHKRADNTTERRTERDELKERVWRGAGGGDKGRRQTQNT